MAESKDQLVKCKRCGTELNRMFQKVYTDGFYDILCDDCWQTKQKQTREWDTERQNLPPEYYR